MSLVSIGHMEISKEILLYIKFLAERAYEHAEERNKFSSGIAIIVSFESVEWLLRSYINNWSSGTLDEVIEQLKENGSSSSRFVEEWYKFLTRLKEVRNAVQHRAIMSETEVYDLCTTTIEFLKKFFKSVLNLEYDGLTFSSLLKDENLRSLAEQVERAYKEKRFADCIKGAADLVSSAVDELSGFAGELTATINPKIANFTQDNYPERYSQAESKQLAQDLHDALISLGHSSTTMQFFSYQEKVHYLRLDRIASMLGQIGKNHDTLAKESIFALSFSVNFAIKAERILVQYKRTDEDYSE